MLKATVQPSPAALGSQETTAPTCLAALAAATPTCPAAASHPDAALIAASAEYIELEKRIAETPEPEGRTTSVANAAWNDATEPLYSRQTQLRDFMADIPATTLDGLRAKAAALRTWLPVTSTGDDLYGTQHGLTWSLIEDILGRQPKAGDT